MREIRTYGSERAKAKWLRYSTNFGLIEAPLILKFSAPTNRNCARSRTEVNSGWHTKHSLNGRGFLGQKI